MLTRDLFAVANHLAGLLILQYNIPIGSIANTFSVLVQYYNTFLLAGLPRRGILNLLQGQKKFSFFDHHGRLLFFLLYRFTSNLARLTGTWVP